MSSEGKHYMVMMLQEKRSLQPGHAIAGPSVAAVDGVAWKRERRRTRS